MFPPPKIYKMANCVSSNHLHNCSKTYKNGLLFLFINTYGGAVVYVSADACYCYKLVSLLLLFFNAIDAVDIIVIVFCYYWKRCRYYIYSYFSQLGVATAATTILTTSVTTATVLVVHVTIVACNYH